MKKFAIIYQDKYIIVVDKPAHVLTVATPHEKKKTLFHEVLEYEKKKHKGNKVFVVHRLDKDTSGLVMFAKDEKIKNILQDNWEKLMLKRGYVALVEGNVKKQKDTIQSYLKENAQYVSYSTADKNDGKLAITDYEVIKKSSQYSLLNIFIHTGRKNQIRVHMHDIGHPIVGDKKYGSRKNPIRRMCLHANVLKFVHPISKEEIALEVKVPEQILNLVKLEDIT